MCFVAWCQRAAESGFAFFLVLGGCADGEAGSGGPASPPDAPRGGLWASWPMPNSPGVGLPNEQSYEVTSQADEEAVLDRVTGLVWQRRSGSESFDFEGARRYCESLDPADGAAWRVPARVELVSLLDLTKSEPAIDGVAFPATPGDWFWTTSESADDPSLAWYTYFYFGYPDLDDRASSMSVRCVSALGGPTAHEPRYARTSETVHDELTRLTWQRAAPAGMLTFAEADSYCSTLVLDGSDAWRLPSMPELQTLVDEATRGPAIDRTTFPETPAEPFWTASNWAGSTELAWYVSFDYGAALYDSKSSPYFVRCVR